MTRTVVFDLDGVIYLGDEVVPGAPEVLAGLMEAGVQVLFCTNNSSRTMSQSAAKISRITRLSIDESQVATSAMAAGRLLDAERVVMIGGDGVVEAIERSGSHIVERGPADAVVVGIDPRFDYGDLDRASDAVRSGARLIATNRDVTFPSPSGLKPGGGSIAAAVAAASGVDPVFAGKPEAPMRALLSAMITGDEVVMVGDRPDTDLAMADSEGWISVLVETGISPPGAIVTPPPDHTIPSIAELREVLGSGF